MTDRFRSHVRLAARIILALALTVPLGIAGAALSGIGHRWVDILAQFTGPALIAAVGGLAAAGLLRSRILIGAAVVVCGLVLAAGAPQWAPSRGEAEAEAGSKGFSLYSANLHALNTDVEAMATSIAAADADVVVLIEVGDAPAAAIDQVLTGYPYRAANIRMDRPSGAARSIIASRRPLQDIGLVVPGLSVVGAVVETPIGPVTVAGVHMTRPWPYQIQWEQIRQAEGLSAWARSIAGPVIAAGDFNSVSSARIGRIIKQDGGLIPAPGWPGTWPTRLPAIAGITIDQVWRTPDLALVDRRLGLPTGSDHRPVITRFVRTASPAA
ncbi:endonuclease/exonuclease/phosphatase family protein [Brevundimonas sp.]|uniref:endonuclease/exonuclease/phosphatase family protein n=1 Tax=Brevundimonas sp. TaxID=1871086 RepID=UPI0026302E99|nr:endonuclease/exonuclease/phosphatase family protein [Brevundimonas sp.]